MPTGRPRLLTVRGRTLIACGLLLVLAGTLLGFADLTRIGVLLLALPVGARLLSRRRRPVLQVARSVLPQRLEPGQRAEVTVEMRNAASHSTPLYRAAEQVPPALGDPPRFVLPRMAPGAARSMAYQVVAPVRGRHTLGPISLAQEDAFGLTLSELTIRSTSELIVLPRVVRLGAGRPIGAGVGTEGETPHMMALHGEDDVSIRGYRDGDDLRKVHWPATAHRGELMVRQEEHPAKRSVVLLLDSRREAHPGSALSPSFEWAVSAVASAAAHLSAQGFTLHLCCRETLDDGTLQADLDGAAVVNRLATVERGDDDEHALLLRRAHDLTERTGALLAVVGTGSDSSTAQLAALRRPGCTALGMVVDGAAGGAGADLSPEAERTVRSMDSAGWRVVPVTAGTGVDAAWQSLAATTAVPS